MIDNNNMVHAKECKCIAWKPIFAGALVAVGLTFLLNLFGMAIGLNAYTVDSTTGAETLALGGLLGTAIGVLASMFAAGWIAGYLGQRDCYRRHLGALSGFLVWCVALIFAIFISSHAHEYVTYYGHYLSGSTNMTEMTASAPGNMAAMSATVQAKTLVISSYIIFVLFFLSAFSAALGGHCGMRYECKKEGMC